MKNDLFQGKLTQYLLSKYNVDVDSLTFPPQGMSSKVFFININNQACAVKYGKDVKKELLILEIINNNHLNLPVPEIVANYDLEGTSIIIMKKIEFQLLESVEKDEMAKYIPSMLDCLKELHKIKRGNEDWKKHLLNIFDGATIDWNIVATRKVLDRELVLISVTKIIEKIQKINFEEMWCSLLHTDFNQRNLFINPANYSIAGIIDWEEAVFGDPVYDFARVRMLMWHFNFKDAYIANYYQLVNFNKSEKELEGVYMLIMVIQYLAWYSETENEFNNSRIKMHQEYLRDYKW